MKTEIAEPKIVPQVEWLAQRMTLLTEEKELTRHYDRVNAQRRRLPMVRVEKEYSFDSPDGKKNLARLFDGRRQLIVYHFMFDPEWDEGCPGCTGFVNSLGNLSLLNQSDTSFALVSRAPLAKLEAYKARKGWDEPWFSSLGSDFNYDYHVTLDKNVAPTEYNYQEESDDRGEAHGLSVFFRNNNDLFHTYSAYARGVESVTDSFRLLDLTPYGRQSDFEESPMGWPQNPTYG
ncbi:MAG: DUF899 domain-containing protein [Armatimonadetes bacterium]|nr:DUF899 domain-containing protein [Armatimonadota bacterium]